MQAEILTSKDAAPFRRILRARVELLRQSHPDQLTELLNRRGYGWWRFRPVTLSIGPQHRTISAIARYHADRGPGAYLAKRRGRDRMVPADVETNTVARLARAAGQGPTFPVPGKTHSLQTRATLRILAGITFSNDD
jgi:hypothetical protein